VYLLCLIVAQDTGRPKCTQLSCHGVPAWLILLFVCQANKFIHSFITRPSAAKNRAYQSVQVPCDVAIFYIATSVLTIQKLWSFISPLGRRQRIGRRRLYTRPSCPCWSSCSAGVCRVRTDVGRPRRTWDAIAVRRPRSDQCRTSPHLSQPSGTHRLCRYYSCAMNTVSQSIERSNSQMPPSLGWPRLVVCFAR